MIRFKELINESYYKRTKVKRAPYIETIVSKDGMKFYDVTYYTYEGYKYEAETEVDGKKIVGASSIGFEEAYEDLSRKIK